MGSLEKQRGVRLAIVSPSVLFDLFNQTWMTVLIIVIALTGWSRQKERYADVTGS